MEKAGEKDFTWNLREARIAAGLTQQAAADLFGIRLRGYCRWEKGETEPPFSTLVLMAQTLNVSLDYLFGLSGEARADGCRTYPQARPKAQRTR